MLQDRKCPTCGEKFTPKSDRNIYDSRRCFKKANYHQKKAEELTRVDKFPTFLCPDCKKVITLTFDPVKESTRWLHFECPECDLLMVEVSEQIVASPSPSPAI